jgi:hypothetical protein
MPRLSTMREFLTRLTTTEPRVLWALVAIVVGFAAFGWWNGRRPARRP